MVLISNTNLIVDDFSQRHKNPTQNYIYFLTHMHSDHFKGMISNWNNGTIYCSKITKILLLNMFPGAKDIIAIDLDTPTVINIDQNGGYLPVEITFIDANHCPGSVMILFKGYMGTILHTGDMRFRKEFFDNKILYPALEKSIHIDELILDNTFCDPVFQFPDQKSIVNMMIEMIEKTLDQNKKYIICIDSLGKEDILIELAEKFDTIIKVKQERFKNIISIDLRPELFTSQDKNCWIYAVQKKDLYEYKDRDDVIIVKLTGWVNYSDYIQINNGYTFPYSLHSNFKELDQFVQSIQPSILSAVCADKRQKKEVQIDETKEDIVQQMVQLMQMEQKGLEILKQKYTQLSQLSIEYQTKNSDQIQKQLGFIQTEQQKQQVNCQLFNEKYSHVLKKGKRQGAQINDLSSNKNFNQEQLDFLKSLKTPFKEKTFKSQTEDINYFKKFQNSQFEFKRVKLFS